MGSVISMLTAVVKWSIINFVECGQPFVICSQDCCYGAQIKSMFAQIEALLVSTLYIISEEYMHDVGANTSIFHHRTSGLSHVLVWDQCWGHSSLNLRVWPFMGCILLINSRHYGELANQIKANEIIEYKVPPLNHKYNVNCPLDQWPWPPGPFCTLFAGLALLAECYPLCWTYPLCWMLPFSCQIFVGRMATGYFFEIETATWVIRLSTVIHNLNAW